MRLTLRALLAYLDEMLEPADAQELGQRIEASPFATDLMHRVRDVTRRLKLGAPKVSGRGLTGDPNTVSEYLDNTMPPEQVTEFEKICLKSDVHLAEVAAAHQILALVLGEPAEVDPKLRRRMYELPQQHEAMLAAAENAAESSHDASKGAAVASQPAQRRPRRRPEVPEWLRDAPKERNYPLRLAVAACLMVAVGLGAYVFFGRSSSGPQVASSDAVQSNSADTAKALDEGSPAAQGAAVEDAAPEGAVTGADRVPLEALAENEPAASPPAEAAAHDRPAPEPVAPEVAAAASALEVSPLRKSAELAGVADAARAPRAADAFQDDITQIPAEGERPSVLDDPSLVAGGAKPAASPAGEPAAAVPVGRLVHDGDILLHNGGPDGGWNRLSIEGVLVADEELIALPTFRPGIAFSDGGGAIAHLLGGSVIRLLAPNEKGIPGLDVIDGQVVISTAGKPGAQLNVQIAGRLYAVTFVGPDARMAVDVRRSLPDGADPLVEEASTSADLYVPSGEIEYSLVPGGAPETVRAPAVRQLLTADAGAAGGMEVTFPAWINGNPLSQVEKLAVDVLNHELAPDEPVQLRLRELADNRRVEVRNLAVHCMTLLGDFENLLSLLNDVNQRSNWSNQIEAVHRALARGPDMAKQLRATLESQRDAKKAKDLYDMLVGYSKRQLQDGAAARLVADLDREELDFRRLAFWNLQRVSVGTLNYRPEDAPAKRLPGLRAWQKKLDAGQIVPRS